MYERCAGLPQRLSVLAQCLIGLIGVEVSAYPCIRTQRWSALRCASDVTRSASMEVEALLML